MQYAKPPLTFEQQADLLIQRGMSGDRDLLVARLSVVNYYRLSGYWHPFKGTGDQFQPGTSFDEVWNRYAFDRRLRLLAIDAIERVEVAVRARLAYRARPRLWPVRICEHMTIPFRPVRRVASLGKHRQGGKRWIIPRR